MRWFRSKGIALFGIALGGLAILLILFVDDLIESAIEKTGTSLIEARVDLKGADLSFFPLGLRLTKLQVTDPDNPMTNAVEVDNIQFSMDTWNLMRRKVIVDEMALEGMRFKTPRKSSGAIRKKSTPGPGTEKPAEETGGVTLPSLDFPSPKEILEKEPLQSMELIESTREDIKTEREDWKKRLDELPDKQTWEGYRKKIQEIKTGKKGGLEGLLGEAGEAVALRKEIQGDLQTLKDSRLSLQQDLDSLKKKTETAARAPFDDIQRLKDKYGLSPEGLSNLSRGLFGKQIGDWAQTALHWYGRAAPLLEKTRAESKQEKGARSARRKGVDIHFAEKNPLPGFLVRLAKVSADFPFGKLSGDLKNVASDQSVLGKPASFNLAGENLKDIRSIALSGKLNHVNPDAPRDDFILALTGLGLKNKTVSGSSLLPAKIKTGMVNLEGKADFRAGVFKARFDTRLSEVSFETPLPDNAPSSQKTLASALSNITGFRLGAQLSGTPEDYDTRISSDLDKILKEAVGKQIQKEAERFEEQLKIAVTEKTDKEISNLKSELAGMNGVGEEIASRLKIGDGLLSDLAKGGLNKGLKGLKLPFGK